MRSLEDKTISPEVRRRCGGGSGTSTDFGSRAARAATSSTYSRAWTSIEQESGGVLLTQALEPPSADSATTIGAHVTDVTGPLA